MSCAPCKVLLLRLARHIEGEDKATMTTDRLHERRMLNFLLAETAYYIGNKELDGLSNRTTYKELSE